MKEDLIEILKSRLKGADGFQYLLDVFYSTETMRGVLFEKPDHEEIIHKLLLATRDFYDAEWCGVIDTDIELGSWTPAVWYHEGSGFNGKTLFKQYESSSDFPHWLAAFKERRSIIVLGKEDIEKNFHEEREHYERLQTHHVIGIPYSRGNAGFFIIKNARKHQDDDIYAKFILFGLSEEIREARRLKYLRKSLKNDEVERDDEVVIKMFGGLEIHTKDGDIETGDLERKRIGKIITLLATEPTHQMKTTTICDKLTISGGKIVDTGKVKDTIYLFRNSYAPAFTEEHFIKTSEDGYCLNPELNIRTDLKIFEDLWAEVKVTSMVASKTIILQTMCDMYKTGFMPKYKEYRWAADIREHYAVIYFEAVVSLCELLFKEHDYSAVVRYVNEALDIFPRNTKLYYWKISALMQNRLKDRAEQELSRARKFLESEEYMTLRKLLEK